MINDDELINIFIEESRDILENMRLHFNQWNAHILNMELLEPILRDLHTLKGNSRMIGLTSLSEFLHLLEQLIQQLYHGFIFPSESLVAEIKGFVGYLSEIINQFSETKEISDNAQAITRLKALNENPDQSLSVPKNKESTQIPIPQQPEVKDNKDQPSISDVIRVRTDLLETFGNLAGQINVARSHLEQQLKAVSEAVSDMTKEIKFIHEKMKHLQMKTDVSIRLYQESTEKQDEEFDVLEMDRYNVLQQSTRFLVDKINQLEHMNQLVKESITESEALLSEQGHAAEKLEEEITHTRLISLETLVPRLERIVQHVSTDLGKEVYLQCMKVEGEIDRKILERLIPSLEHMVRNAIDHGIELPQERIQQGKPPYGVITLELFRQSSEIVIVLGDDGQGLDIDKIKQTAVKRKLWDGSSDLPEYDAIQFILVPGFTTKEEVTEISGYGVGMDVVNNEINRLGGTIRIETQRHYGVRFIIRLPFTLSLSKALVFYVQNKLYAIQISHLVGIIRLSYDEVKNRLNHREEKISYANKLYDLFYLPALIEKTALAEHRKQSVLPILFVESGNNRVAFVVDKLMGSCEVVIKPAGQQLQFVKEICGVSVLGNGQIVLILDAEYLIQRALAKLGKDLYKEMPLLKTQQMKTTVLIVDDSNTVRQVMTRFLRRHQYLPLSAKDGEQAFQVISETLPDIILLDIEMPKMDGFQVLEMLRKDKRYQHIPVIMITSRAGEKHRLRAMKLGANDYLSKPYRDEELLSLLRKYHASASPE